MTADDETGAARITPRLWTRIEHRARRTVVQLRGQRVLAILGMHRSGTSSLAGSLEQAGLYLGDRDVAGAGQWNAKGNRESKVLMRLHEQLLGANGGSWDDPPETVVWAPQYQARRDRFIRSRSTRRYWGFKDPRAILVIDGWLEAIPDLSMVATIREPVAVALSLQRRAGTGTLTEWLELWLAYNERLLRLQRQHGFAVIDFDLPAPQYEARLAQLIGELGLRRPRHDQTFFESSLRSSESAREVGVPEPVEAVYAELQAIAASGAA